MSRSGARLLALAAVVAAVAIGAVAAYGVLIPRMPGRVDEPPTATFSAPATVLAPPAPPSGLHFEAVRMHDWPMRDWMAVYGRADNAGPGLAAIFHEGSDALSLPFLPEADRVFVNAHRARLGRLGDDIWLTWSVWFDADQEIDQYAVVGRGVPEADVVRAARHLVTPDGERAAIDRDGLPDGFEPLAAGAANAVGDSAFAGAGTTIRWTDRRSGRALELTAVGVNDAAAVLALAQVRGDHAPIRAGVGVAGSWIHPRGERARAWLEGRTAFVLTARGVPDEEIDLFVAALRPADAAALAALRRTVAHYPPGRLLPAGTRLVAGGRLDGGVWAIGRDDATKPLEELVILLDTGEWSAGSGSPQQLTDPLTVSMHGMRSDTVVVGAARPPVASVRVTMPDGGVRAVALGPPTADGTRWFAVRVPGTTAMLDLFGYDAGGMVVARAKR